MFLWGLPGHAIKAAGDHAASAIAACLDTRLFGNWESKIRVMKKAKISEIFRSIQGEGLYVGVPQVFIRFYGCNTTCVYCDTNFDSFKTFQKDALMDEVLGFKEPYHSISITGGEPLLQAEFLNEFLPDYKKSCKKPVYLETNGILYKELERIIKFIDIISMDCKLPSSAELGSFWEEHRKFLEIAKTKEVFVKSVVTSETKTSDLQKMLKIIKEIDDKIPLVIQPVSTLVASKRPKADMLERFTKIAKKSVRRVEIIGQVHKMIGVK